MVFAPTRSGKGVGFVVPTLLTWPGSVVVHDIKGENWHLKGSFLVPLAATLRAGGLKLDVATANREVLRWLAEVANVRIHGTTGAAPNARLVEDHTHLARLPALPTQALPAPARLARVPFESLQHPLSIYDSLLESAA